MSTQMVQSNPDESIFSNLRTRGWNLSMCGAVFGLVGGIVAPIVGSVFTAVGWLSGPTWHGLAVQRIGTVLLFSTIPLLLFGAHCLDLSDRKDEQAKHHFPAEILQGSTTKEKHSDPERN